MFMNPEPRLGIGSRVRGNSQILKKLGERVLLPFIRGERMEKLAEGETRVYEVKGKVTFPFSYHVQTETLEDARGSAYVMSLPNLLLALGRGISDVNVEEVVVGEDAIPF
jgi:hypothetical protein